MTVHVQVSRFIVSSASGPNLAGPDLAGGGSEPDPITPGAAQCDAGNTYALPSGTFVYLGQAASLGMTAAPNCGS